MLNVADPLTFFQNNDINTGDVLVFDAILKHLLAQSIDNLQFCDAAQERLWPAEQPDATVIRGSNYLNESLDLGHVLPLLKRLKGPVVAMGVGAQAASRRPLAIPRGSAEFWRAVAGSCVSLGVRGAYSAEVFNSIGVKNLRIIGCPSFYRSLQPELRIRRADSAMARVGLTLNKYLSNEYASSFSKTNRLQRALLAAVARRENSRVFSQGEREESLLPHVDAGQRPEMVNAILDAFGLRGDRPSADLINERMSANLDVDAWADEVRDTADFMVGFRLHGNVVAFQQGIPGVYFTYDTRIRELATLFQVPSIEVDEFMPVDLNQIIERAEFGPFERAYRENFEEYRRFLNENGLSHRLGKSSGSGRAHAPPSTPHAVPLRFTADQLKPWLRQEVDHLASTADMLLYRAWKQCSETTGTERQSAGP
jgi:polysaccharide pyruvyl transferase WcaK-like protein